MRNSRRGWSARSAGRALVRDAAVLLPVLALALVQGSGAAAAGLSFIEVHPAQSADDVTVDLQGRFVYLASGGTPGPDGQPDSVRMYAREPETGALTLTDEEAHGDVPGGFFGAQSVAVSTDGAFVYVGSSSFNKIVVFSVDADLQTLSFVENVVNDENGVVNLDTPIDLAVSADGASLYAAGFGSDSIVAFTRNTATGTLTYLDSEVDGVNGVEGMLWTLAVAVSPNNSQAYGLGFAGRSVNTFARDMAGITPVDTDPTEATPGSIAASREMMVSADGAHVYTVGGQIAIFERDAATGTLTEIELYRDDRISGSGNYGGIVSNPDGTVLYASEASLPRIVSYARDPVTGLLDYRTANGSVTGPGRLAITLDGTNVYVADASGLVVLPEPAALGALGGGLALALLRLRERRARLALRRRERRAPHRVSR